MKYLAAAVIAIPLGFAAFLLWPVDYDGQAAGVMQIGVRDPLVTLAATLAFGVAVIGLCLVAIASWQSRLRDLDGSGQE